MTTTPALRDLGDVDFVQLTTFRRSGEPVRRFRPIAGPGRRIVRITGG